LDKPLKVGVVVTTSEGAEGYQDLPLAAGARIAQYRLSTSKHPLVLDVQNDDGTSAGSSAAVRALIAAGVSGIVYASEGQHITSGLREASAANTPVLLPYQTTSSGLPDGAWLTGPSASAVDSTISEFLTAQNISNPIVVTDSSSTQFHLSPASSNQLTLSPSEGSAQITQAVTSEVTAVTAAVGGASNIAAVVFATAQNAADVVAALEESNITKIIVGPDALSPVFADSLSSLESSSVSPGGATAQGTFDSVGENVYDAQSTDQMQSFLASLRLVASDASLDSVDQASTCFEAGGAATADTRSQDAVIALATAAAKAGSTRPSKLLSTLTKGLSVTIADGLAGPDLTFLRSSSDTLMSTGSVVMQEATAEPDSARETFTQSCSSGQQPQIYELPALQWFGLPTSSGA
jgi:hypothetical protein